VDTIQEFWPQINEKLPQLPGTICFVRRYKTLPRIFMGVAPGVGRLAMRSISYLPQLLTVLVVSVAAAAQSPWSFPLERQYVATSLNGQNYDAQSQSPTLTITRDPKNRVLLGAGFAGCNSWNGRVVLAQKQFGVGDLGTTKMFCVDQMANESGFLSALKAVKRWHMEGPKLVLEGEQTNLTLSPAKPDKL
jgi:heat shock protein HslJ